MPQLINTIAGTYKRCCAENIGISHHFIRQLALSGKIPTIKAGNTTLINYNVLMRYLENGVQVAEDKRNIYEVSPVAEVIGRK